MTRICKVLIVEDDDNVRALLGDLFEDEGYHFTLVRDGAEMEQALDGDDYDVSIIDVSLAGGESGFTLAQTARDRGCGVILTSGDPRHFERLQDGEWRSIAKPFRVQQLIALVDRVLKETAAQCVRRTRSDGTAFPARA